MLGLGLHGNCWKGFYNTDNDFVCRQKTFYILDFYMLIALERATKPSLLTKTSFINPSCTSRIFISERRNLLHVSFISSFAFVLKAGTKRKEQNKTTYITTKKIAWMYSLVNIYSIMTSSKICILHVLMFLFCLMVRLMWKEALI